MAGSAAGIFGLTNLSGFYVYFASLLVTNVAIFVVNIRLQPRRYLLNFNPARTSLPTKGQQSTAAPTTPLQYLSFLIEGAQEMAFGYVLWWTLWTAIIHGESTSKGPAVGRKRTLTRPLCPACHFCSV